MYDLLICLAGLDHLLSNQTLVLLTTTVVVGTVVGSQHSEQPYFLPTLVRVPLAFNL